MDTLAKVRKPARGQAVYQEDYSALESLLPIAAEHQVAILVVHHLRQMPGADPQDEISGSSGLTGGVDGWLILRRAAGSNGPTLLVDGRDIEQPEEYALQWDADTAAWSITGLAEEVHLSDSRRQIQGIVKKHGPMMPKEVGDMLPDLKNDNVRRIMVKMLEDDQLDKDDKGRYVVAVNTVNEGDPDVHSEKDDTEAESGPTVNGVNGVNGTPGGVPAEVIAGAEIVEGEL